MRAVFILFTYIALINTKANAEGLLKLGAPFDESYRALFSECDQRDTFRGSPVSHMHRCTTDPSRFNHLARVPAKDDAPGAVIVESKIAHDDDGAAKYCPPNHPKGTSQCQTALLLQKTTNYPCKYGNNSKACVPVDPNTVSYIVISGRSDTHLGLSIGDYGMVVMNSRSIPFIVGDIGLENKIGEGSTTLLKKLSSDGKAHTVSHGAVFVLFPGTADKQADLFPDNIQSIVEDRASKLYQKFIRANP